MSGGDYFQALWPRPNKIGKRRDAALIPLDCNDTARTSGQQGARQTTWPWPDFQYRHLVNRRRRAGDFCAQVGIKKEVLAERFTRAQAMSGYGIGEAL